MKLPDYYDIYSHNKYLDKLVFETKHLAEELPPMLGVTEKGKDNICTNNLRQVKALQAILTHLELALEEILHLREKR